MRINVYSQELTDEVQVEEKQSNTGVVYTAVRIMLHSSPMLHHPPKDDDRSGITFWLPKSQDRREALLHERPRSHVAWFFLCPHHFGQRWVARQQLA